MKVFVLLVLASLAAAKSIEEVSNIDDHPILGYHTRVGIPLANKIREEEKAGRIFGGLPATLGQFNFHVGIVIDLIQHPQSICSGALLSSLRVLTSAHCWWNRRQQAWRFTLVAGATTIFSGGHRRVASGVTMHGDYDPVLIIHNIAIAQSPTAITNTAANPVGNVRLPVGEELLAHYGGFIGTICGFGILNDGATVPTNAVLRYINQFVITNTECRKEFPYINDNHICAIGGANLASPCYGDAGAPLTITRASVRILVGILSYGHHEGCELGHPVVFTRISAYNDWIRLFI